MTDLFDFDPAPPAFAVVGNPIAHSKSPEIHAAFAKSSDVSLTYERMHVDIGGFKQAVDAFAANGGRGLNVTVPFKLEAWRYADHLSERAQQAEAVNTLRFDDDGVHGENTDGVGFVRDLVRNHGYSLAGKRVLIVGAGGAVQGMAAQLLGEQPSTLIIANRTVDRAVAMATRLRSGDRGDKTSIRGTGLPDLQAESAFDLIIHATSAGLSAERPPLPGSLIESSTFAYDIAYGDAAEPFLNWARQLGAAGTADGLGMLVEQAAASFYFWHGVQPETGVVIKTLAKQK